MKKQIFIIALLCLFICSANIANDTKCDGEAFDGEKREAAKTSIGTHATESMTVEEFLATFKGVPELDDNSERNAVEQRNVTVTAWLYTYAREGDEDFHLILGNTTDSIGRHFMSAEVSGLPKSITSPFYTRLHAARQQFKTNILKGSDYCGAYTRRFLKKPLKVTVTGSVFYDTHHASGGSGTGIYKSKSAWEIHPVTGIAVAE